MVMHRILLSSNRFVRLTYHHHVPKIATQTLPVPAATISRGNSVFHEPQQQQQGLLRNFSGVEENLSAKEKLRAIFEEYRVANYRQTLTSRFAKEIATAADADNDGAITLDEITQILDNIGAKEKLSEEELKEVMDELSHGNPNGVPIDNIIDYLKN